MSASATGRNRKVSTKGLCKDPSLAGYSTAFKYLWRVYLQGCLRTGREWDLSPSEFMGLITAHCHYCGSPPTNRTKIKQMTAQMSYNGVDRVDNAIGYTAGNVVPCCKPCNSMKSAQSEDEFIRQARRITEHQDRISQASRAANALQPDQGPASRREEPAIGCDPLSLRSRDFNLRIS
jgi:hypothetical protein